MFQRCMLEREKKLKEVRNTIAQSKKQSLPVRTTKLAYVDSSFVKPPRQVRMYFFLWKFIERKRKMYSLSSLTCRQRLIECRLPRDEIWRCRQRVRETRGILLCDRAKTKIKSTVELSEEIPVQIGVHQGDNGSARIIK